MSKKAIVVVSFGTSYEETRRRTIEAIEDRLHKAFPDRKPVRAWTSNFIIRKVAREQGLEVLTPEKALLLLQEEGYTDILVQPTHLTDGYENRRLLGILAEHAAEFEEIRVGRPLLYLPQDKVEMIDILDEIYPRKSREALVLMGHGSEDRPAPDYDELNSLVKDRQVPDILVGTVEGEPGFASVEKALDRMEKAARRVASDSAPVDKAGVRTLLLAPLMIVAGDHANNDLAGEDPESWKSRLEAKGYQTRVSLQGLGEFSQIQDKFARHAAEAKSLEEWM